MKRALDFRQTSKAIWRTNDLLYFLHVRTHETDSEICCSLMGHNNTKDFFVPNQEPAFAKPLGNGLVRVGTQQLIRLFLKTFVAPFPSTQLTVPGSPTMGKCKTKNIIARQCRRLFHNTFSFDHFVLN